MLLVTDGETMKYEAPGLRLGAEDYIRRPFVSDALMMRIRRIIDMTRFRHNFTQACQAEKQAD